jgi:hypothetical protein
MQRRRSEEAIALESISCRLEVDALYDRAGA